MHSLASLQRINGQDIDEQSVIDQALAILERRARKPDHFITSPGDATAYVRLKLAEDAGREHFPVVYLDNRHGVIAGEVLFHGTIDGASVHPRIVLQRALALKAAAVVLTHNHPSGNPEPSTADSQISADDLPACTRHGVLVCSAVFQQAGRAPACRRTYARGGDHKLDCVRPGSSQAEERGD